MHRTAIVIKLSSLARFKFIVMTNDWPGSTWPVGSSPQFLCTWHDALMVSTLSRLKSYKSAILSAADWRSRSAHDLRHESVMNDDVHVMKSMTPGSVFSRGQCGVMRVITWIMAPTDHCYWPFLLPVSRSPPCLDQLGHWLLVNIPRPRVTDSARSAEICLGLVKPDSENDSVSFTPPFIHILIDYKHCIYLNFTHLQKKPKSQS